MVRTVTLTSLSFAFLPLAVLLITLGIYLINTSEKRGIWLKLAMIINSSFVLMLGMIGCGSSANSDDGKPNIEEMKTCYAPVPIEKIEPTMDYENSDDWMNLEESLIAYEKLFSIDSPDKVKADELLTSMLKSVAKLQNQGYIKSGDAELLTAYLWSRDKDYKTSKCSIRCYRSAEPTEGKEQTQAEIIRTIDELKGLYESGNINSESYTLSLQTLEEKLKLYTGKDENDVLRQLLLDLVDGKP